MTDEEVEEEEELLPANSPLGRYAAEVGLGDAVTAATALLSTEEIQNLVSQVQADPPVSFAHRIMVAMATRLFSSNSDALRRLLAEDDLRELLAALIWLPPPHRSPSLALAAAGFFLLLLLSVWLVPSLWVLVAAGVVFGALLLLGFVWLKFTAKVSALLSAAERCLSAYRACIRLTRERRQADLGFTFAATAASPSSSSGLCRRARWSALSRTGFESARRLTHAIRCMARRDHIGGLAVSVEDAEFGEAFNPRLTPAELALATEEFAPTALTSMAGLLQLHISDAVRRFLTPTADWAAPTHVCRRLRFLWQLFDELLREADVLEARLERQRYFSTDLDSLLAEFLGAECREEVASAPLPTATAASSQLDNALRSLRLQAEALLAKAALAGLHTSVELTAEARIHAVNALACCDEIAALTSTAASAPPHSPTPSAFESLEIHQPARVISPDSAPEVEDEFLEGFVPLHATCDGGESSDDDGSCQGRRRRRGSVGGDDEDNCNLAGARRRATTANRMMLSELGGVIAQRRRLFHERECLAREKQGLPPPAAEDADQQQRHQPSGLRRRIIWHGNLEEGVGDSPADAADAVRADGALPVALPSSSSSGSMPLLMAAAFAARRQEGGGIRLAEEAFGDDDDYNVNDSG